MKRLLFLFMVSSILVSFDKSAPKVLLFIKDGSQQLEYMLTNEVGKMSDIIKQSGYEVTISTISGEVLKAGSVTVEPDLKLSEVNIDDYAGFIFPCMVSEEVNPELITFVKAIVDKGKPIAAQAGSVGLLINADVLNGKKYTLNHDAGADVKDGIYSGTGVVQDGIIITSGTCPWIAKETGWVDGTAKLTQTLVDAIKAKNK
jgi:putative intracellular protease/amidase